MKICRTGKERKNLKTFTEAFEILIEELQLTTWIKALKKVSIFSFSTVTDNHRNLFSNLIGLSFSTEPRKVIYVPVDYSYLDITNLNPCKHTLKLIKPLLEDKTILKIGQNLKRDRNILQNYDIDLRGIAFDTMLESYVLNSVAGKHDIHAISSRWLKDKTFCFSETVNKNENQSILLKKNAHYTTINSGVILQLHLKMWSKLQQYENILNIYKNIEIPLVPVLARIERNGVKIDPAILYQYSKEISQRLADLEKKAHKLAKEPFNLSSTKQLQEILFKKQGMKPLKKTPRGSLSTSENVLERLAVSYPLPKILLEYRSLAKLKSAYIDRLPLMIHPKTGRVHTSYNQAVTATGRLSSTTPNLQNIPIRSESGRRIRQAFTAPKDYMIISADYSQIELRIMAHLSHDKNLLMAFSNNKDIHRATAAEIFDTTYDGVSDEQRRKAKIINFGIFYGISTFGLSDRLNIPFKKSQQYINLYFERYPGVWEYMKRTRAEAKNRGYVETLEGRRIYLPNIESSNLAQRSCAERIAINAPMQGTAADIIKRAMISVDAWFEKEKPRAKMIMQVHDELVFEVHQDEVEVVSRVINKAMENSVTLDVPLLVKIGVGDNWDQAH